MKKKLRSLLKRAIRILWPLSNIVSVLVGLLCIFMPRITGWVEVFQPVIADSFVLLMFLWAKWWIFMFILIPIGYLTYLLISDKRRLFKLLQISVLCTYVVIWQLEYPSGMTASQRRISAYRLGAQARIAWAGGSERVRTEALAYAKIANEVYPPYEEWPQTLQKLAGRYLRISEDKNVVNLSLPRYPRYMRSFQYIIQTPGVSEPAIDGDYRIWSLGDGVYLIWILD